METIHRFLYIQKVCAYSKTVDWHNYTILSEAAQLPRIVGIVTDRYSDAIVNGRIYKIHS